MIFLQNGHLIISAQIVTELWGDISHVSWVFYANKNKLLLCAMHDEIFKQLHKTNLSMLKLKNAKGDRSVSLQELIIDNNIDNTDRQLEYSADTTMRILSVTI